VLFKQRKIHYHVPPFSVNGLTTMADENFKESFGIGQLALFIIVFVGLLCLAPIVKLVQIIA